MQAPNELIKLIKVPKIEDDCILCFAQTPDHIPFKIRRFYYITTASTKLPRGFHAHKKNKQVLFCIQGSIKVTLDNGKRRKNIFLDQPNLGIIIDNMIWHEMEEFKENTILLILASREFNEKDYIRDYEKFKKKANKIH